MSIGAQARLISAEPDRLTAGDVLSGVETGVLVTDEDGNVRYANSYAAELFGLPTAAEVVGRPLYQTGLRGGDSRKVRYLLDQVLAGRPWEGTLSSVRRDGTGVFVRAHAAALREHGQVTGVVIMARAAEKDAARAPDRIGLIELIGERLAGSLELDVTLRKVLETLVPQFADHCFIDLRVGSGDSGGYFGDNREVVRRAQFHAADWTPRPGTWADSGETISYPAGHFCTQAMVRRDTVVVEDMAADFPSPSEASQRMCREIGLTSVLAAPLIARGELLGVLSLALSGVSGQPARRYTADDRDFASAIAGRVAVAIDNALLFEAERRTALAFQTALLPREPPALDGLEVAYSYVPAKPLASRGQGIQTQVGGDWYDIIPLSAGRVGIVIGDVEGRGAGAAAVMGQLRAALRAFAQDDMEPAEILRRLDDWCRTLSHPAEPEPPIVSCLYLVYDAWSRRLSLANAGHLPPLVIRGTDVRPLDIDHRGVVLGVRARGVGGAAPYREETRYLPPGATLVLYTDGLTDRRQRADGPGHYTDAEVQRMLRQAAAAAAHGSPADVAHAVENAVPGEIDDDMAIVVVRTSPADLASWEGRFPAEPVRVPEARHRAAEMLELWGIEPEQAELTCLLVSEVVTNVVLHATTGRRFREFTLRLRRGSESLWVEVFDGDLRLPRIRSATDSDEGGRGLYLVDQIATRWGSRPTNDGKSVWFELPARNSAAASRSE